MAALSTLPRWLLTLFLLIFCSSSGCVALAAGVEESRNATSNGTVPVENDLTGTSDDSPYFGDAGGTAERIGYCVVVAIFATLTVCQAARVYRDCKKADALHRAQSISISESSSDRLPRAEGQTTVSAAAVQFYQSRLDPTVVGKDSPSTVVLTV